MPETFDTTAAAAELGVDSRSLRRFLRRHPAYRNAGSGGRYLFTRSEISSLKKEWARKVKNAPVRRPQDPREDPESYENEIVIPKMTPLLRREVAAQEARLEQQLLDAGLHLSQLDAHRPDGYQQVIR